MSCFIYITEDWREDMFVDSDICLSLLSALNGRRPSSFSSSWTGLG